MPTNYDAAYTTMTARFIAEWNAQSVAIVNPAPTIRITGIERGAIPTSTFVRITVQEVIARQATLRNDYDEFALGQRYRSEGLVIVQVLTERKDPAIAAGIDRKLCQIAQGIFRGKEFEGGIIFNNVRINKLEPEPSFLRSNMIAEYVYDEIG